ncbi:hypothetical protein V6N13_038491 [Hibiscus sabdariffa]
MQRENVVNLNKGLSSRAVSEDKVNDNDIGSVDLKVGPEGISSQLPEPLSVNTDKKGRNLGSTIEAHSLKKSWASVLDAYFNSGEYNVENNSEQCESLSEGENAKDLFEDLESWKVLLVTVKCQSFHVFGELINYEELFRFCMGVYASLRWWLQKFLSSRLGGYGLDGSQGSSKGACFNRGCGVLRGALSRLIPWFAIASMFSLNMLLRCNRV